MHPLLKNHQSWILTALFVAVTNVHQVECEDVLVKSLLQDGKTGYLKTYEKTYHTKYEFDLNNALHQTGRLLRKLASPVVAVERDPELINEEQLQETSINSEEYCDSEEEELIRELHNKAYGSKAELLHEKSAEEHQRPEEEVRPHAKGRIFNIGKLFFKPMFFKKTHDPGTSRRHDDRSDDHLQIHDPDSLLRSGRHSEEGLNTTEVTDAPSAEEEYPVTEEEPDNVGEPLPSQEDDQQSEELLPTTEETQAPPEDEQQTLEDEEAPSEDEHQTLEDEEEPCTTVAAETVTVGKKYSKTKYSKKKMKKKLHDPVVAQTHENHSGEHPKEKDEHSAENGQLHPHKEVIIEVGKPFSMLNLFQKNLEKTFHKLDTVNSHGHHHSEKHLSETESSEEHSVEIKEKELPRSKEVDVIVGKPLLKSRVFKRLHKPVMVSVLKNFKLMFNVPIKFSKYEAKHSLEPLAKTHSECVGEDEDYGLIT